MSKNIYHKDDFSVQAEPYHIHSVDSLNSGNNIRGYEREDQSLELQAQILALQEKKRQLEEQTRINNSELIQQAQVQADKIIKQAEKQAKQLIEENEHIIDQSQQQLEQQKQVQQQQLEQQKQEQQQQWEQQLEQAKEQVREERYEQAQQEGYQRGLEKIQESIDNLGKITEKLLAKREQVLTDMESDIVQLVLFLVNKIVLDLSKTDQQLVQRSVREVLTQMSTKSDVIVHISREDFDLSAEFKQNLIDSIEKIRSMSVIQDPQLSKGDCLIETEFGNIDAKISTKLRNMERLLLGKNSLASLNN